MDSRQQSKGLTEPAFLFWSSHEAMGSLAGLVTVIILFLPLQPPPDPTPKPPLPTTLTRKATVPWNWPDLGVPASSLVAGVVLSRGLPDRMAQMFFHRIGWWVGLCGPCSEPAAFLSCTCGTDVGRRLSSAALRECYDR